MWVAVRQRFEQFRGNLALTPFSARRQLPAPGDPDRPLCGAAYAPGESETWF
jgi:hypothetical protein